MSPFVGLLRLLQSFVIEDLDQVVDRPFTASVALEVVPFGVVVASEGDAMVSPAIIPERNSRYASIMIFMLMMVVTVTWLLSLV